MPVYQPADGMIDEIDVELHE